MWKYQHFIKHFISKATVQRRRLLGLGGGEGDGEVGGGDCILSWVDMEQLGEVGVASGFGQTMSLLASGTNSHFKKILPALWRQSWRNDFVLRSYRKSLRGVHIRS